jgi:hypothetical protein
MDFNLNSKPRDLCGATGKIRFATKPEAAAFLAAKGRQGGCTKVQRRCAFCDGFHLTKGVRGKPGKAR